MAYKPIALPVEPEQELNESRFIFNGGINFADLPQKLADNQSPDLMNVWFTDRILSKRMGQSYLYNTDYLEFPVHQFHKRLYNGHIVFHAGTKLYEINSDNPSSELEEWSSANWATAEWGNLKIIHTGLTSQKGSFFVIYEKLYYINGAQWVVYDGSTCANITPYLPNVLTATTPAGAGTADEDYNRVGAGFSVKYNGNGSATVYTLPQTGLDATTVTITIGGVAKTEGTHFTVDRTAGTVNFGAGTSPHGAPASGTNNVIITAYKTNSTEINGVLNCKYAIEYGDNKNIVFLCGNGKGEVYWSEIGLPTYIRSSNTNTLGDTNDNCTGFGIQYDTLIIFKSRTLFSATQLTDTTFAEFAFKIVNDSIGCDIPYSIQLINNRLVWANTYGGVYTLATTLVKDEKNVKPLSRNINGNTQQPGFLQETLANKQAAISFDYVSKSQYWLCVNGKVYMWDYGLSPYNDSGNIDADQFSLSWWIFDSINANCFFENAGVLYHGLSAKGNIVYHTTNFNDFDSAISSYYVLPLRDFGATALLKTIKSLTITCRADTASKINIEYMTESSTRTESNPILVNSFSWARFSWATLSWAVIYYGRSFTRYPNSKHCLYWGAKFYNSDVGRDLSIVDIICKFMFSKKVK
jgi:hypothetical protein